jgi:hypothetical protein
VSQEKTLTVTKTVNDEDMKRKLDSADSPAATLEMPSTGGLLLPSSHRLSLALAEQAHAAISKGATTIDRSCRAVRVLDKGLVEVVMQAGESEGYGASSWRLRIGGAGIGDEPHVAAAIGTSPQAPVAVRFHSPVLALRGVDDEGFCDAAFFEGLSDARDGVELDSDARPWPTLQQICERAAEWLSGAHLADDGRQGEWRAWQELQSHTLSKLRCIAAYRKMALCPALVADDAQLLPSWLSAPFRSLLGSSKPSERCELCKALLASGAISECAPSGSGVWSMQLFAPEMCTALLAEVEHFEASDLPRRRPNTMNKSGLVVNEIGSACANPNL